MKMQTENFFGILISTRLEVDCIRSLCHSLFLLVVDLPNGSDFPKPLGNMGRSPNYGRNSNIFNITNGLNFLHRKSYTGNQYMVKSAENRMRSNLEGCRT
jgi:hypothetical protein